MLPDARDRELTTLVASHVPAGLEKLDGSGPITLQDWPSHRERVTDVRPPHKRRRRIPTSCQHEGGSNGTLLYDAPACLRSCGSPNSGPTTSKRRHGAPTLWLLVSILGLGCGRASALAIETPQSVVQCMSTTIQWSGGIGPYFLSIHPPGDFNISNDQEFNGLSGDSMAWTANVAAGTKLIAVVTDTGSGTGVNAQTNPFIVGQGPNDSCLGGSPAPDTSTPVVTTTSPSSGERQTSISSSTTTPTQVPSTMSPNTSRSHSSTTAVPPSSGISRTSDLPDTHSTFASPPSGSPSSSLSSAEQPGVPTPTSQVPTTTAASTGIETSSGTDTPESTSVPIDPPSPATTGHSRTLSTGDIIGIAIVSVLVLSGVVLMLWWCIRPKRTPQVISPFSDPGRDAQLFLPHRPQLPSMPSTKSTSAQHTLSPATSSGRSSHGVSSAFGTSGTSRSTLMSEYDALIALAGIIESPSSSPSPAASARSPVASAHSPVVSARSAPVPSPSPLAADMTGSAPSIDSRRSRRRARIIREPRYESDGGIRIAGGPIGAALEDEEDVMSEARTSILPPPYHMVYGS
ncbi:hypothetical protein GY45DRAFT_1373210 [Cubamyces sp. BRFM 1775]|nr:hypothetical protein GY45DRAFT_1373210 [Cubamyces sp. BRFM 1775]